jgi:isoleucyl-tRNA synthetase
LSSIITLAVRTGKFITRNLPSLEYLDDSAGILVKRVKPNFKALGPKVGGLMKKLTETKRMFELMCFNSKSIRIRLQADIGFLESEISRRKYN